MSSKKYATPLAVELSSSLALSSLLLFLHLGAIVVFLMLALSIVIKILVVMIVLISLYYNTRLHSLLRSDRSIVSLRWLDDNEWQLMQCDGVNYQAHLNMNSYLHPKLTVLNFNLVGSKKKRTVMIFSDAIDKDSFRRLRVRLRLFQSLVEQE